MVFVIGGLDPTIYVISDTLRFCSIYMSTYLLVYD